MKIKVKAVTSVMHGRHHMQAGDELEVTKGEADELRNAGLVQLVADEPQAAAEQAEAPATAPADDDVTDLLGGDVDAKMAEAPQNKMEPAPENKAGGKKSTAKKAD